MGRINDDNEINFEYITNDEFLAAHNDETREFLDEVIKIRLKASPECKYYLLDSMILALENIEEERYEKLCGLYVPVKDKYYPGNYDKAKAQLITELRTLAGEYSSDRYLEKLYMLSPFSYIDRYLYEHISESEFPAYINKTRLNKSLQQFIMKQTKLDEIKNKDSLYDEYFGSCSDKAVEEYLSTVASVFSVIRHNIQNGNMKKRNLNTLEKLKAVSYFVALYYGESDDTKNYKGIIKSKLASKGFTKETLDKKISFEDHTLDCEPIFILHSHFDEHEYTSSDIAELFNSIFVEDEENAKLISDAFFYDLDIDEKIFSDIYDALIEKYDIEFSKTLEEYNSLLEPGTIEYLELCSKIYSLFQKNGFKKDGKIIQSVDDYSVLTHVVACLFNNSDLTEYLKLKGITIDDITKLTGVELNYDEIINLPLNMRETLISFYSMLEKLDYEYDSYHEIDIDDFIELVCDSDKTGSRVLHRLISSKTKISLPNNFYNEVENTVSNEYEEQRSDEIKAVLGDLNIDTLKFIQMASYYYDSFKEIDKMVSSDNEMASILCALLNSKYYKDGLLFRFLKEKGLDRDSIFKYYFIDDYYTEPSQYYIDEVSTLRRFSKYLYEGNNKGKNRGEITIEDVLSNIYNKEVNKNIWIYEVLDNMGIDQDIFKDLDKKLEEYKKIELTYRYNSVKRYTPYFITFKQAYVIYNYLIKNNDYTEGDINTMKSLSLLVSLLLDDEKYTEEPKKELLFNYFNNGGIDLDIVIDECGFEIEGLDLNNLDYKNVAIENIYSIFSEVINSLEDNLLYVENDLNLISLLFIVRRLFYLEGYSTIFEIIIDDDNIVDKLENSFKYENMENIELPLDKILKQLKNTTINIPNINPDDIDNVYKFVISGDKILFKYSDYIVRQVDEIDSAVSDYGDKKEVKNMLGGIYIDKPRYGIITRIFNPNDVIRKVDNDALNALSNYLNEYISTLEIQINKYSEIRDVISLYLDAIKVYNDCYSDLLEKMNAKYTTEELDDIKRAKVEEIIGLLNAKVGSFDATYNTMYVYLEQLSNAIKTHLIILNSLKVSKCNIIPILKTSVLFNFSNNSGKEAIVMSNILRDLCKNLIIQDQAGIQDNLALLEKTELPDELMTRLETDIDTLSENAKVYGIGGKK